EPLSAQTAIPPSRPAEDRAPLDGRAVMAPVLGHICRRKRLASAASSTCSPQPHRPPHLLSAGPKQAKSRNTHSSQPVARRFGLRGLSGAYRQPKLFTKAVWQLSIPIWGKWTLASAIPFRIANLANYLILERL